MIIYLKSGQHVLLYVGDGKVIHSTGHGPSCTEGRDNGYGLTCDDVEKLGYDFCAIGRISSKTAEGIDEDNVVTKFTGAGYDEDGIEYNGTTEGHYKGTKTASWLFENFIGFLDYLFGMIAYILRAPFVGWANIVENMINDTITNLSGVTVTETAPNNENNNETNNQTEENSTENQNEENNTNKSAGLYKPTANLKYDDEHRINIEDIIYNKVPLLDVDFFDVDLSETKSENVTISDDSVIYKIRENVALWYNIIRSFSIISLLMVLIYLGIRLAISTVAGDKAKYKSMLTAWVTSFIIVFLIHLFMIAVIEVNDVLVDTFKGAELKYTGGLSMYDTIRTRAYSLKLSEGIPATVMYIVLIYFLIRFLFVYLKRYFTVIILALMGPIMAIKYAFDKINTGKSGSMAAWMYDFALNVLLQSVHALLYTALMAIAFDVGMESIPGFIFALFILNFIFKAEDIFIDIFKFDRAGSLGDNRKNVNYFAEAFAITRGIGFFTASAARFGFGAVKNTTKFVGDVGIFTAQTATTIGTGASWAARALNARRKGEEIPEYTPIDVEEKMKNALDKVKGGALNLADNALYKVTGARSLRLGLYKMKKRDPELYNKAKSALDKNRKLTSQVLKRSISGGVKSIKTMASLAASVPMMVVSPGSGVTMFASALSDIKNTANGKEHYGYMSKKEIRGRRGRIAAVALTGAAGYAVLNAADSAKQIEKDKKQIAKNEEMLNDLRTANMLERDIEDEINKINKELEKEIEKLNEEDKKKAKNEAAKSKLDAVNQSLDSAIKSRNLKGLISDYMAKNNLTRLSESDVEKLLKEMNLNNIEKEISELEKINDLDINKLKSKLDKLKTDLQNEISTANNEQVIAKTENKISEIEQKIKQKELIEKVGLETIKEVKEEIANNGELSEGIFMEKQSVEKIITEYMDKNNKQDLDNSDVSKIRDLFNNQVKKDKVSTYASKDSVKEQVKKQDKKKEGLNQKKAVESILNANENDGGKNINVEEKYQVLTDKLRELELLNEKSINKNGRSIVDMRKFIKNIKK